MRYPWASGRGDRRVPGRQRGRQWLGRHAWPGVHESALKGRRRMPRSGRLPRSATSLDSLSMTKSRMASADAAMETEAPRRWAFRAPSSRRPALSLAAIPSRGLLRGLAGGDGESLSRRPARLRTGAQRMRRHLDDPCVGFFGSSAAQCKSDRSRLTPRTPVTLISPIPRHGVQPRSWAVVATA